MYVLQPNNNDDSFNNNNNNKLRTNMKQTKIIKLCSLADLYSIFVFILQFLLADFI